VRVIAAPIAICEQEVGGACSPADLFYRLNVFPIEVPPLRDRKGRYTAAGRRISSASSRQRMGKLFMACIAPARSAASI